MESKALVSYLEKIRYGRNISQEDMIHGVISIRQYRRYLYGEVEIPFGVFSQLANKINVSPRKLLLEFEEEKNREKKIILSYYNAVITHNFDKMYELEPLIDQDNILDIEQEIIYKSAKNLFDRFSGKISTEDVAEYHKKLVNFPAILSNKILTDDEMYLLGTISQYDPSSKPLIMNKLEMLYENDQFHISGDNVLLITQILFWLAKNSGSLKDYEKTIKYCEKAIEYNSDFQTIYLLEYFYYYKALAQYRTNQIDKYKESLYTSILVLEAMKNTTKIEKFYSTIKKDLGIEPLEFLHEYIGEKLGK